MTDDQTRRVSGEVVQFATGAEFELWLETYHDTHPGFWLKLAKKGTDQPAITGFSEIERAQADGRWDAAYAGQRSATVPEDLQRELDRDPQAATAFAALDSRNRYAIIYRVNDAKRPETRDRRITKYVDMLRRGERIHN
jgi:uncharacterized protein YdeI (YjbR/CyaY-like superfamily)